MHFEPLGSFSTDQMKYRTVKQQKILIASSANMTCSPCSGCVYDHDSSVQRVIGFARNEGAAPFDTQCTRYAPGMPKWGTYIGQGD